MSRRNSGDRSRNRGTDEAMAGVDRQLLLEETDSHKVAGWELPSWQNL